MTSQTRQSPHEAGSGNVLGGEVPGDSSATGGSYKPPATASSNKGRIEPLDEIRILRAAACDWRLSRGDVGVLAAVLRHADDSWLAFPGTRIISGLARLAASNVITSIGKLERFGYLRVTRRGQRKRQDFQLLTPPDVLESAPARKSSGFGKSAPARKSSGNGATAAVDKSSTENTSAPVDMKLSAPVDRNLLLLCTGTEGTLEGTIEVTKRARAKKQDNIVLPNWIPSDAWEMWIDHRKQVGRKFTQEAQRLAIRRLETLRAEGHDPRKLIELAIESCWSSFNPRESTKDGGTAGRLVRDNRSDDEIAAANEAAMARFGGAP